VSYLTIRQAILKFFREKPAGYWARKGEINRAVNSLMPDGNKHFGETIARGCRKLAQEGILDTRIISKTVEYSYIGDTQTQLKGVVV